jgi:hypothetical protein
MLDKLTFGMSNIKVEGGKPGSEGSTGAMTRETGGKINVTAGDLGSWNKTDLVMLMVNDSHPQIHYAVFPLHVGCAIPSHSLQLVVYNFNEQQ